MAQDDTLAKIAIIIGSTRAKRIGPQVAQFIKDTLESQSSTTSPATTLSLVDISSFNLPVFDEEPIPAMVPYKAQFAHAHSIAWSAEIAKYDAYILVSAEYNFGTPGGVKNAVDYLYNEWKGKPIMIVTYGILGGMNASESLKKTLEGMHLDVVETRPMLTFPGRDPANSNMSPDLLKAMVGVLGEDSVKAWGEQKEDILKAFDELKAKLVVVKN